MEERSIDAEDNYKPCEILSNRKSIQDYEKKSFKAALPQIFAAVSASTYHLVAGMCLSYSAILIPQLFEEQELRNGTTSGIEIDKESASWIASVLTVITIPSALFGGVIMDCIGRLHLIRLSSLPTLIGWVLIASANNMTMLIVGRVLTGIPIPWGTGAGATYITEISSPRLRGSLVSFNSFFISLGFLVVYICGSVVNWRVVSWICTGLSALPLILLTFLPESPSWLIMRGRSDDALQSFEWYNKYQNESLTKIQYNAEQQRALLNKQQREKTTHNGFLYKVKLFLKPTCYKPLLILCCIFFFQQFTGIYMTLVYAVNFMQDVGVNVNPYVASIYLGAGRFFTAVINVWIFRYCKKRPMLFVCTIGMAVTMTISGTCTKWIQEGKSVYNWILIVMPVLYVIFSMIGLLSLPFIYGAELFPLEVRAIAQSVSLGFSYVMIFIAIKCYFVLEDILGGASGLQYFFALMSLAAFIFCYIFVPETHKKKLSEIEDHFRHHSTYLSARKENAIQKAERAEKL